MRGLYVFVRPLRRNARMLFALRRVATQERTLYIYLRPLDSYVDRAALFVSIPTPFTAYTLCDKTSLPCWTHSS